MSPKHSANPLTSGSGELNLMRPAAADPKPSLSMRPTDAEPKPLQRARSVPFTGSPRSETLRSYYEQQGVLGMRAIDSTAPASHSKITPLPSPTFKAVVPKDSVAETFRVASAFPPPAQSTSASLSPHPT